MSTPQISALRNSARKETIISTLKHVVNELTGIDEDAIDVNANFIETGVDSLMLIQAVQVMQDTLGIKLSAVQLMEELTSLDLVADYIDERLPQQEVLATETRDIPGNTLSSSTVILNGALTQPEAGVVTVIGGPAMVLVAVTK